MGTPTILADLVKVQKEKKLSIPPSIVLCGGAAGSIPLYDEISEVLNVKSLQIGYGITEALAVTWPLATHEKDFTSVGYLLDHLEAKIVDITGNVVPVGTNGELHVRGYSVLKNYLDDSIALDKDGWFKTGDVVHVDGNGKFYISGRVKDIINRGGEKINPGEVEDILTDHPNILEVYVVGSHHDRFGEEVCACVRLQPGSTISLEEIKNFSKGKLSYYKIPSKIEIMDDFPKTSLGKIQKSKLVEQINRRCMA